MEEVNEQFRQKLAYLGYRGINIEKVSLNTFKNFLSVMPTKSINPDKLLSELPTLSLEEVRELTKIFCQKYFSLNDIFYISTDQIQKNKAFFSMSKDSHDLNDRINSKLTKISPLDLEISLVNGHSMVADTKKQIIMIPNVTPAENRKVYFSSIDLGNQLTKISAATLVHEIAHLEQEQNIGYAEDFLNKEIISIFLEKVAALEMDPTEELLKKSELIRFNDVLQRYYKLVITKSNISTENDINDLLYIKSTFYAEKLFDMYLSERKQKHRDKYFYQIQDVFDGKITVEDLIRDRNITPAKTQDLGMLKRHIR